MSGDDVAGIVILALVVIKAVVLAVALTRSVDLAALEDDPERAS